MFEKFLTDDKTRAERLALCNKCEYKTRIGVCSLCFCVVKQKVKLKSSYCDAKKWAAIPIEPIED